MVDNIETLKEQLVGLQKKYNEIEEKNRSLNDRLLELYSLYKISTTLSSTFDFKEIMKSIRDLFRSQFDVQQYSIMLLDDSYEHLVIDSSFGISKAGANQAQFKFGEDIFGEAVESGQPIYVPDMSKLSSFLYHPGEHRKSGSFLCVPLIPHYNRPIGVLSLYRDTVDAFNQEELLLIEKLAEHIAKVIDKTLLFQQTKELSITDDLTKVYNRRYFNQRFEREVMRSIRYRRPLTVVMLDIDHFKKYNDTHGHLMGDEVIKKVARTLDSIIRKADILARYGGEEFILLLPEITKLRGIQAAEKFRKIIETTHFENEETQPGGKLTISLGLATLPDDTTDANMLLEMADQALYKAKEGGRNRIEAHDTDDSLRKSSGIHQIKLNNHSDISKFKTTQYAIANA